jgi:hypothetical protein
MKYLYAIDAVTARENYNKAGDLSAPWSGAMQGKLSEITGELHFQAPRSISNLPEYGKRPGFILEP